MNTSERNSHVVQDDFRVDPLEKSLNTWCFEVLVVAGEALPAPVHLLSTLQRERCCSMSTRREHQLTSCC